MKYPNNPNANTRFTQGASLTQSLDKTPVTHGNTPQNASNVKHAAKKAWCTKIPPGRSGDLLNYQLSPIAHCQVRFNQNPSCRIMLEPKEVYTPRIDRIEHNLLGETLVHRIFSVMPYVLCTWYPSGTRLKSPKTLQASVSGVESIDNRR